VLCVALIYVRISDAQLNSDFRQFLLFSVLSLYIDFVTFNKTLNSELDFAKSQQVNAFIVISLSHMAMIG
jgi:hypothetical protein